jgi:hypothetical protein
MGERFVHITEESDELAADEHPKISDWSLSSFGPQKIRVAEGR